MKFLYSWIRDFVDTDLPPGEAGARWTSLGFALDGVEPWGYDSVLDVDVTTNRPDAMNHRGLAREMAAGLGLPLGPLGLAFEEDPSAGDASAAARIRIEAPDLCRRYCGRVVEGLRPGPSPGLWADRLQAVGLRPVNHVVDATNYVLHELGHPLHAFDLDTLAGGEIVVRRARAGEKMTTLDGVERTLDESILVIADAERPVALAGIMGGLETEIGPGTRRVLLESAHFDPATIRRAARRLGIKTDASQRFERGADIGILPVALERTCALLQEGGPARVLRGVLDAYPGRRDPLRLRLRLSRCASVLGLPVDGGEAARILGALDFEVRRDGEVLELIVPTFRVDVEREIDLIEEVARHMGYGKIPSVPPPAPGTPPGADPSREGFSRIRSALTGAGFREAIRLPFVDRTALREFGGREEDAVRLRNPLVEDLAFLRMSLVPGLLAAVEANLRRGEDRVLLFETGRAFRGEDGTPTGASEQERCALVLTGPARPAHWSEPSRPAGFFEIKGAVQAALRAAGAPDARFVPGETAFLHPAERAEVLLAGERVAWLGRLHPDIERRLESKCPVYVAELRLGPLLGGPEGRFRAAPVSRFPWSDRDFTFLVPHGTTYEELRRAIDSLRDPTIRSVEVAGRYEGKGIPEGMVSLTLSIRFQAPDRTLTQEEVARSSAAVVECLSGQFGVRLRV